ncbi:chaplin [Streptomyces sp. TP-A0874]|uniref:chaplin n=1 Tax=Streptomyces sp. TP-A0874 TaxID=549819 RepID=UPI0008537F78|nr:chaplin [Streptomyces sp. TP-A0874]
MKTVKKAALTIVAAGVAMGASAGTALAANGAGAQGAAVGSPGFISGNVIQVPIDIPVNLCGNTISVIGLLDSSQGHKCINGDVDHHGHWKHHR